MKRLITVILLNLFATLSGFASFKDTYHVSNKDVYKGYVTEKVWLTRYALPQVQLTDVSLKEISTLPADAIPSNPNNYLVKLGIERKKPFAFISIPAYTLDPQSKQLRRISDFTLSVTEAQNDVTSRDALLQSAKRATTITNSVLSAGTWYKIAITNSGFYKVDYNFLTSAGINVSTINMHNIRVFGNGGNMLPEDLAVPRKNDLVENAIEVVDNNGNGAFDKDDYFIFYAIGPTGWIKDSVNSKFTHQTNVYENNAYYFLNFDQPGLRLPMQASVPTGNETVTDYNDYILHEQELVNLGPWGRQWLGEEFSTDPGKQLSQVFSFNLGSVTSPVEFNIGLAAESPDGSGDIFNVALNGVNIGSLNYYATGNTNDTYTFEEQTIDQKLTCGSSANISIDYKPVVSSGNNGYLDYIEINYRHSLSFTDNQFGFRDWNSVGTGKIATYQLQNATANTEVWDVTDPQHPVKMNGTFSGGNYSFTQDAQMLHEFAAMNNNSLFTPTFVGGVANQNLHGTSPVDYIIVTHPDFLDAANQLADYHRQTDNMRVVVVTTTQVYNEFSSGSQDISAIRDFTKMLYDRAGTDTTQMPRYLLLFGGGSYDYKNRIANNTNYVPTYESALSNDPINSLATDDFFAILDDSENIEDPTLVNSIDIGVGRLPVTTLTDAENIVNKIKNYKSANSFGSWRLSSLLVADNEDLAGEHLVDAEDAGDVIENNSNLYNATKVYEDALQFISTPGGTRCPQANQNIDGQIYKGTFVVNYTGHGNYQVWATERILTEDDYNKWNNANALPFMITATCDFGVFDNPAFVSAGAALVLRNNGGVIANLTTTQESFENGNVDIDQDYLNAQFEKLPNGWHTFGDAFRIGKDFYIHYSTSGITNLRKFVLFGDPALVPDFPQYNIRNDSVLDAITGQPADTIKALGSYVVSGSVLDGNGNVLNNFNGNIAVTIYDKPTNYQLVTKETNESREFQVQDNIVYRGKATVTNGHFSYRFVAPKDINYEFGKGKVSSYANSDITDAAGADTLLSVGGFSDNPVLSTNPPIVKPYIGDSLFINGGITGNNTSLFVQLYSDGGINVTGNNVGHDLTAVLDGDIQQPYILNDYYQTLPNTYQQGYVSYPVSRLADGKHSITVKAWDVNDNSAEGTVDFEVVDGKVVQVQNLMNYPNPFRDQTHFVFEENHPEEQLDAEIAIYNTAGVLVKTLKQSFTPSGSRSNEIVWDGTDDHGVKLSSGVYVYHMVLSTSSGIKANAYQKLVIVR